MSKFEKNLSETKISHQKCFRSPLKSYWKYELFFECAISETKKEIYKALRCDISDVRMHLWKLLTNKTWSQAWSSTYFQALKKETYEFSNHKISFLQYEHKGHVEKVNLFYFMISIFLWMFQCIMAWNSFEWS